MLSEELSVAALPLFEGLSVEDMEMIAPLFRRVTFPSGARVFSKGEEASDLYVLESGEVGICVPLHDGGYMDVATVQRGGIWGWSAALGRPVYTSAAICVTDVRVIATRGIELRRLMRKDNRLGVLLLDRMSQVVAHRFESFRAQLTRLLRTEDEADRS